jgi:hypothetical protein
MKRVDILSWNTRLGRRLWQIRQRPSIPAARQNRHRRSGFSSPRDPLELGLGEWLIVHGEK